MLATENPAIPLLLRVSLANAGLAYVNALAAEAEATAKLRKLFGTTEQDEAWPEFFDTRNEASRASRTVANQKSIIDQIIDQIRSL